MFDHNQGLASTARLASLLLLGALTAMLASCSDASGTSASAGEAANGGGATGSSAAGATPASTGGQTAGNGGLSGSAMSGSSGTLTGGAMTAGSAGATPTAGVAGAASGGAGGAAGSGTTQSAGCGKPRALQDGMGKLQIGGVQRTYVLRAPASYDESHPYRLVLDFHGAGGKGGDLAPSFFGLWDLAQDSTIFAAPDAVGGFWKGDSDTQMVSALLDQLEGELCIDTSHVELEGFSQGAAMVWTLACALPGKFRAAVVHSGGGLPLPTQCQPIPFFSSLGHDGSGQGMSSDFFAMTNGCKVESLPAAPSGGHACSDYSGCSAGHPTRWCGYDGGHTPAPTDAGQATSWMPQEAWNFLKRL